MVGIARRGCIDGVPFEQLADELGVPEAAGDMEGGVAEAIADRRVGLGLEQEHLETQAISPKPSLEIKLWRGDCGVSLRSRRGPRGARR